MARVALVILATIVLASSLPAADDFAAMRAEVLQLAELTTAPAVHSAEGVVNEGNLRAIYYDALPWNGRQTRVFAWLGLPKKQDAKVPGIVLVHGGGGTAFKEWVQLWNDQGFAAISIAVEGQTDQNEAAASERRHQWARHEWAGPQREGIFADTNEPLKDQWAYHALADTILANSLLRSLPEVDADRVGVMGISWGGVVTSTVIGIDSRFAFAIPTYGCGHLFDAENQWGRALGENQVYREVWDPMQRMDRVKLPVLWLSWPQDSHFPLDAQAACYRAAPWPHMVSLIPKMGHSHVAGWKPPDSYAFAKSIVNDGQPWSQCEQVAAEDGQVRAEFRSDKPFDRAELISTRDTGFTGDREWHQSPATMTKEGKTWVITAPLPDKTTAWFVNAYSGDLTASSDYVETK